MHSNDAPPMPTGFIPVPLDELPSHSPWPARIVGLDPWDRKQRDAQRVREEYGGKWGRLREGLEGLPATRDLGELLTLLHEVHFPASLLVHRDRAIFRAVLDKPFWDWAYGMLRGLALPHLREGGKLVELGCGWGRVLFRALADGWCAEVAGGEFTEQGVALAQDIAKRFDLPATFGRFDHLAPDLAFAGDMSDAVAITVNSLEQIPLLGENFVDALCEAGVRAVVHLEPVHGHHGGNSLWDLMARRYTHLNNYNTNLLDLLRAKEAEGRITILREEPFYFGLNCFNPCSGIVWAPRS